MRAVPVALCMLAPLIGVTASACGGDVVQLDPVAKAADVTAKQSTMHMTMQSTMVIGAKRIVIRGDGDFDSQTRTGNLSARFSGLGKNFAMTEVIYGSEIYMQSPLFAGLPAGKTWIRLDLKAAMKKFGVDLDRALSESPADMLERLKAHGTTTKIGTEVVGGITLTHYRFRLDSSQLPAKLRALHPVYDDGDVWIDSRGFARRVRMSFSTGVSPTSQERERVMTDGTLSKFGEAVDIQIPTDAETLDITSQAADLLGNGG